MKTLFFTLENDLKVMVIPDTQAHLNGHAIITHTYSIFLDSGLDDIVLAQSKESRLHLKENLDPDYYGFITFEKPDSLFTYTADGRRELNSNEVTELIEHLSNVRDNPALWDNMDQDQ